MRVSGEAYFLINVWMDFLSLYLAGALMRLPVRGGRYLLAAVLGGAYALVAWEAPFLRSLPALMLSAAVMALIAFGRDCLRPLPVLLGAGFLLAGSAGYLMDWGVPCLWILLLALAFCLLLSRVFRKNALAGGGKYQLLIRHRGRQLALPALRDSGNLLCDPVSALPVIIAPQRLLAPLIPGGVQTRDLSTLPPGWRLIRIETAGGERTLMAFHPEVLQLQGRRGARRIDAMLALSDFAETRALLPEAFFDQKEEGNHASL